MSYSVLLVEVVQAVQDQAKAVVLQMTRDLFSVKVAVWHLKDPKQQWGFPHFDLFLQYW